MDAQSLAALVSSRRIGRHVIYEDVMDSTNARALALLKEGAVEDGTIIVAGRQTGGRGSAGTTWVSDNTDGLWMSVVLTEPPGAGPVPFLPAIAVARVLARDFGLEPHLKWPNDVLVGRRKIAGILVEAVSGGVVIGLGLNVNQPSFPPEIANIAVSMAQLTGKPLDVARVFALHVMEMDALDAHGGDLVSAWKARTRMIGTVVRARRGGADQSVTVRGVTPEGYLLVEHADGRAETWISHADLDIDPDY